MSPNAAAESKPPRSRLLLVTLVAAVGGALLTALLVNIFERKQEARNPFFRVVELTDEIEDPAVWGKNFPLQYDGYRRTVDQVRTRFGGSEAVPRTPTEADPRSWSRSPASRRIRGSRRCGPATPSRSTSARSAATPTCSRTRPSPSASRWSSSRAPACTATPRSTSPTRSSGGGDLIDGLREDEPDALRRGAQAGRASGRLHRLPRSRDHAAARHPPRRSSRASARSRPRRASPTTTPTRMATRQEMRTFVCGQCHVEYYFKGPEKRLTYPVGQGAQGRADPGLLRRGRLQGLDPRGDRRRACSRRSTPSSRCGTRASTRARGVACADCHMPYSGVGAHQDQRPPRAQPAAQHQQAPARPATAGRRTSSRRASRRSRTEHLRDARPGHGRARRQLIDEIKAAQDAGRRRRRARARRASSSARRSSALDFVEAENSMGFHAPQEARASWASRSTSRARGSSRCATRPTSRLSRTAPRRRSLPATRPPLRRRWSPRFRADAERGRARRQPTPPPFASSQARAPSIAAEKASRSPAATQPDSSPSARVRPAWTAGVKAFSFWIAK